MKAVRVAFRRALGVMFLPLVMPAPLRLVGLREMRRDGGDGVFWGRLTRRCDPAPRTVAA
jgi:hypothetical protein